MSTVARAYTSYGRLERSRSQLHALGAGSRKAHRANSCFQIAFCRKEFWNETIRVIITSKMLRIMERA